MEYLCTTCCQRKRRTLQRIPALERYLSRRIRLVWKESRRLHKPLLILSGKYGLLTPDEKISFYDHALQREEIEDLLSTLKKQLASHQVSRLVFYALPKNTSGWRPYYEVIEKACASRNIPLKIKRMKDE